MNKRNLMNNTKTRRKGSMLQDILSKMKFLFVLAVLMAMPILPMQAIAGGPSFADGIIDDTDLGAERLVSFWDLRERESFVQVTNTSAAKINIHVQFYDVGSDLSECNHCNFVDMLTPKDTHVYNIRDIVTNFDNVGKCPNIDEGSYGFVVISHDPAGEDPRIDYPLIGMFRVIDDLGYEYRTNSAGKEIESGQDLLDSRVNFSSANGNVLSDLVGITYLSVSDRSVVAPGVTANFGGLGVPGSLDDIMIFDEDESATSCGQKTFSCAVGNFDRAIDSSLPNSKGLNNQICDADILFTNTAGWVNLPFNGFSCSAAIGGGLDGSCETGSPFFVGFLGLNNGDGTGTMDSFWFGHGMVVIPPGT